MADFIKGFNQKMEAAVAAAKARRMDGERLQLLQSVGQDVAQMLGPVIMEMAQSARMNKEELRDAMYEALGVVNARELNIDTKPIIEAIQQAFVGLKIPEPKVTVTSPSQRIPDIKMPDEMNIKGWLEFMNVFKNSDQAPISVQLRDYKGNPVNLLESVGMMGGGGGGGFRRIIVDDIRASNSSVIDQALGAVKVTGSFAASLSLDYGSGEIGSATPRFVMATDAVASVYVTGANGSLAAAIVDSSGVAYSGSNPLPITIISGSSSGTEYANGATKATPSGTLAMGNTGEESGNIWGFALGSGVVGSTVLRIVHAADVGTSVNMTYVGGNAVDVGAGASSTGSQRVILASNSVLSTITSTDAVATQDLTAFLSKNFGFNGTTWDRIHTNTGDSAGALRVTYATDAVASVYANNPVNQGDAATALRVVVAGNSDVSVTATQAGTWTVTSITNSVAAALVDSGGVQYSTSNPVPVVLVANSASSTVVVGDTLHDAADIGAAPVKVGGVAMQTNPTAVADGDRVNFRADDFGRQLTRPVQVRDLILTSRTAITNGTEATLLTAAAGSFADLIYIMAANNSDAAVSVDIRGISAGNVMMTLQVPANGTVGIACPVPLPQDATGNAWTADLPDITGTTVTITALYSKEA